MKHYLLYVQPVIRNLTLFVWTSYQLYCGRITPCCQEEWNGYIVFSSSNNCVLCNRHHAKSFLEVWFLMICVLVCICFCVYVLLCVSFQFIWPEIKSYALFTFLEVSVFVNYVYVEVFQRQIQNRNRYLRWRFQRKHLKKSFRKELHVRSLAWFWICLCVLI